MATISLNFSTVLGPSPTTSSTSSSPSNALPQPASVRTALSICCKRHQTSQPAIQQVRRSGWSGRVDRQASKSHLHAGASHRHSAPSF